MPSGLPPAEGCPRGPLMAYDWLGLGYAALVASGGIIGYARAGGGGPGAKRRLVFLTEFVFIYIYIFFFGGGRLALRVLSR